MCKNISLSRDIQTNTETEAWYDWKSNNIKEHFSPQEVFAWMFISTQTWQATKTIQRRRGRFVPISLQSRLLERREISPGGSSNDLSFSG